MSILRLLLLSLTMTPIFVGFAMPYAIPGPVGWLLAIALILLGAGLTWAAEGRSRHLLEADNPVNNLLRADGDELISKKRETDDPADNS